MSCQFRTLAIMTLHRFVFFFIFELSWLLGEDKWSGFPSLSPWFCIQNSFSLFRTWVSTASFIYSLWIVMASWERYQSSFWLFSPQSWILSFFSLFGVSLLWLSTASSKLLSSNWHDFLGKISEWFLIAFSVILNLFSLHPRPVSAICPAI